MDEKDWKMTLVGKLSKVKGRSERRDVVMVVNFPDWVAMRCRERPCSTEIHFETTYRNLDLNR